MKSNPNQWLTGMEIVKGLEKTNTGYVFRNVKTCELCGGSVDRHCGNTPDPHFIYATRYFECTKCGAVGDPVVGMMCPNRSE